METQKQQLIKLGISDEDAELMIKLISEIDYDSYDRGILMRGVGYDIANSNNLSDSEKKCLINACEEFFYHDTPLSQYHKHLLYRVRKSYHIVLSGLSHQAEASGLMDKIFY